MTRVYSSLSGASPNLAARALLVLGKCWPFYRGRLRNLLGQTIVRVAGDPLIAGFRGASFVVHNDGHVTEMSILLYPHYNAPEIEFLLEGLPVGGTALDLGSNIGLYSLPLAVKAGPHGKVLSLDASSKFAAKLAANAKASDLKNIVQEIIAVGDRYEDVSLISVDGNPGTAIVAPGNSGIKVEMQPLLDILKRNGITQIDVLKIDIDGSEEIALVPFLKAAEPSLLPKRMVMEHIMLDVASNALPMALKAAGYTVVGKTRSNSLYERRA